MYRANIEADFRLKKEQSIMFSREKLENNQVWLYVVVILLAAGFGLLFPEFGTKLDGTISIIIAILMYSMFSQIPFTSLKNHFRIAVSFGRY